MFKKSIKSILLSIFFTLTAEARLIELGPSLQFDTDGNWDKQLQTADQNYKITAKTIYNVENIIDNHAEKLSDQELVDLLLLRLLYAREFKTIKEAIPTDFLIPLQDAPLHFDVDLLSIGAYDGGKLSTSVNVQELVDVYEVVKKTKGDSPLSSVEKKHPPLEGEAPKKLWAERINITSKTLVSDLKKLTERPSLSSQDISDARDLLALSTSEALSTSAALHDHRFTSILNIVAALLVEKNNILQKSKGDVLFTSNGQSWAIRTDMPNSYQLPENGDITLIFEGERARQNRYKYFLQSKEVKVNVASIFDLFSKMIVEATAAPTSNTTPQVVLPKSNAGGTIVTLDKNLVKNLKNLIPSKDRYTIGNQFSLKPAEKFISTYQATPIIDLATVAADPNAVGFFQTISAILYQPNTIVYLPSDNLNDARMLVGDIQPDGARWKSLRENGNIEFALDPQSISGLVLVGYSNNNQDATVSVNAALELFAKIVAKASGVPVDVSHLQDLQPIFEHVRTSSKSTINTQAIYVALTELKKKENFVFDINAWRNAGDDWWTAANGGNVPNWTSLTAPQKENVVQQKVLNNFGANAATYIQQAQTLQSKLTSSTLKPITLGELDAIYRTLPKASGSAKLQIVKGIDGKLQGSAGIMQVASQANFLEATDPSYMDLTSYPADRTQGPQASIAVLSSLLERDFACKSKDLTSQPSSTQPSYQPEFENKGLPYKHGYFEPFKMPEAAKAQLLKTLNPDNIRILVQTGTHEIYETPITQVFNFAPSFQGYSGKQDYQNGLALKFETQYSSIYAPTIASSAGQLCEKIVVPQYRAIAQLAAIRSLLEGKNVPLELTMVGQGAFANPPEVLKKAFEEVKKVVAGFDVTVYVHAYGDNNVTKAKAAGAEE